MSGSMQVGKESPTASAAAFGAQGRDTTASTMTVQLVRKAWRCWWLDVGNGPTDTGFTGSEGWLVPFYNSVTAFLKGSSFLCHLLKVFTLHTEQINSYQNQLINAAEAC